MLHSLYSGMGSPVAEVIVSIAIMLFSGFAMTRVTKRLRLPNVTAYIVVGILIGPFCLDCIPARILEGTEFLADIALAFIAFSAGEFFRFNTLRSSALKVTVITLFEALMASVFVFAVTRWVLHLDFSFAVVLSALASATAPASTMMTIRQTHAKGDFVDTLLQVVAYDDIVALVAYSIAISVALASASGREVSGMDILVPIAKNAGVLLLGCLFGLIMKPLLEHRRSSDNRLIIAIAMLFTFCGICAGLGMSPLLGCMSMGTVYINVTDDDKLFKQLNYFSPPILLLFFVRSGVSFDLEALIKPSAGEICGVSLLTVGVLYFLFRIAGKYVGALGGCWCAGKPGKTCSYLGLALIPQAGVAIGLAALGSRALGGELGEALETVILSSSVLYELVGPACAKLSLYLSGSYSDKLEDLVTVEETLSAGERKTAVDLLVERIQKIQVELAREAVNEEEKAFTEAAEAHAESCDALSHL